MRWIGRDVTVGNCLARRSWRHERRVSCQVASAPGGHLSGSGQPVPTNSLSGASKAITPSSRAERRINLTSRA